MLVQVCLVYNAGELSLIEYGQNSIMGSARTEHMSPYLISVCINPPRGSLAAEKKMAYLIDKQTAKVTDLLTGVLLATVSHTAKIDWLVREVTVASHMTFNCPLCPMRYSSCFLVLGLHGNVALHITASPSSDLGCANCCQENIVHSFLVQSAGFSQQMCSCRHAQLSCR